VSARLKLSWGLASIVLVAALVVGALGDTGPKTQQEQMYAIATQVKCPECAGQTVAESDTAAARGIRRDITAELQDGQSSDEILDGLASSYGEQIVLTPTASGVTGLVWMLPVVAGVVAIAGLVVVFRRWSTAGGPAVTDADRAIVKGARDDQARREAGGAVEGGGAGDAGGAAGGGDAGDDGDAAGWRVGSRRDRDR
jgi:cytochrome c-type biogenesis protein CcmH